MGDNKGKPLMERALRRIRVPSAQWLLRICPPTASLGAVGAAAVLLALALLVRVPMDAATETPLPPYITVYPLLPVIGFVVGLRVGVVATMAALVSAWYFWVEPFGSFDVPSLHAALTLMIFAVVGPVAVGFGALARHALEDVANHKAVSDRNAHEAVHRTKNLLAAVSAVVRGEAKRVSDPAELAASIESTLAAMSRAQDVLIKPDGTPASLAELIEAGLSVCARNPRLKVEKGPDVILPRGDFSGLVLALHELCTNSLKYGALGSGAGRVDVSWTDGEVCHLKWIETGVEIRSGAEDSFGSRLIRGALAKIDGGSVSYVRQAGEVRCEFVWRPDQQRRD